MGAFPDQDPKENTFGDLTIKDLTQITYNGTYSEKECQPTAYRESAEHSNTYSRSELDSKQYGSEISPV